MKESKKVWGDKGAEFAEALKSFVLLRGYTLTLLLGFCRTYNTIIEKNSLPYMEDYGYMYIHKLPPFVTTLNSRQNSSIDMRPNTVKNCHFMFILYSQPLGENKKLTFKTGDRVRISKYDLHFLKVTSRNLH